MRVVYFGTSEFAIPTMKALVEDPRFDLAMIVTQPDAKAGRGMRATSSAVAKVAEEMELEVLRAPDINDAEHVEKLKEANAEVFLTAAFGQKLSDEVLGLPSKYALNLHGSLLPKYRGAAPVQHAIRSGDSETGVTLMGMTSKMDAGPIYAAKSIPIENTDTGGTLMDKLAELARDLFLENSDAIEGSSLKGTPQDESAASPAPMFQKEDGRVRWPFTAEEIDRHVRAMTPWPSAFTFCPTDRSPQRIIVVKGAVVDVPSPAMPGTVVAFTTGIEVATKKGVYQILEVKRSGKRALSAVEFLRGFPIPVGTRLQ